MTTRLALLILDGFGVNDLTPEENSITQTQKKQTFDGLFSTPNYTQLEASGRAVGLLDGFMGNSEVGHMTIGSGQIVKQSLLEINDHFEAGTFSSLPAWQKFITSSGRLHLAGMLGFAGIHAYQEHLYALIRLIPSDRDVSLHLWMDGRDSGIHESVTYLRELETFLEKYPNVSIASVGGRYFGMDRDNNWSRTERAFDAMNGGNPTSLSPTEYLEEAYASGISDEFIEPAFFTEKNPLQDGDAALVFNFRPDRGRQITELLSRSSKGFSVFTMTKFYDDFTGSVMIDRKNIAVTLGSVISDAGLTQLHLAETEKFAHVTRYFNGVRTTPFPLEEDILVPSHKVEGGYDLDPDMSADEILAVFREKSDDFDFFVINLANGDMVGHSGKLEAGTKAVEALDRVVREFIDICDEKNIALCITADHGNCENMGDHDHPQTSHTTNPVPFWYISHGTVQPTHVHGGLVDVAPTVLAIMGIPVPEVMEGKLLLV